VLREVRIELYKLLKRTRSYLGFGWMVLVSFLVGYGIKSGPSPVDILGSSVPAGFLMVGSVVNSEFLAYFMLFMRGALLTFVSLFVCLVTGDLIAGEAADGTLRPLVARPISRARVLSAKFCVAVLYSFALTLFLGVAALAAGLVFFGHGDLMAVERGISVFPEGEALVRILAAYMLSGLAMLSVGTLAFFLSTVFSNSLAALGGAMMTMFALLIMQEIPYFHKASQYFFTKHMEVWRGVFMTPVPWQEMLVSVGYLGAYTAVFFAAAMFVFTRKDVLA